MRHHGVGRHLRRREGHLERVREARALHGHRLHLGLRCHPRHELGARLARVLPHRGERLHRQGGLRRRAGVRPHAGPCSSAARAACSPTSRASAPRPSWPRRPRPATRPVRRSSP